MEEMFEYLIPLTGLFKKKRDPKTIASYKGMDDFEEIVADFKVAKSYLGDAVRIGERCIFRKEKVTIFYLNDIKKAYFNIHGSDPSDEYGTIRLVFADGSEELLYKTMEIDSGKVTQEVFATLNEKGIETAIIVTR